jgi:hypothetical protein
MYIGIQKYTQFQKLVNSSKIIRNSTTLNGML